MLDYKYSQQRGSLQEAAQSPTLTTIDFNAILRNVIELVPASVAHNECVIPLRSEGEVLVLATDRPRDIGLRDKLTFLVNRKIVLLFAPREQVRAAVDRYYGTTSYLAEDFEECANEEIAELHELNCAVDLCETEPRRNIVAQFGKAMHGVAMSPPVIGAPGED